MDELSRSNTNFRSLDGPRMIESCDIGQTESAMAKVPYPIDVDLADLLEEFPLPVQNEAFTMGGLAGGGSCNYGSKPSQLPGLKARRQSGVPFLIEATLLDFIESVSEDIYLPPKPQQWYQPHPKLPTIKPSPTTNISRNCDFVTSRTSYKSSSSSLDVKLSPILEEFAMVRTIHRKNSSNNLRLQAQYFDSQQDINLRNLHRNSDFDLQRVPGEPPASLPAQKATKSSPLNRNTADLPLTGYASRRIALSSHPPTAEDKVHAKKVLKHVKQVASRQPKIVELGEGSQDSNAMIPDADERPGSTMEKRKLPFNAGKKIKVGWYFLRRMMPHQMRTFSRILKPPGGYRNRLIWP